MLFGPVRSVYAELRNVRPGARVDDDTFVALQHRQGTVSHLWASLAAADRGPRMRVLGRLGAFVKFGVDAQEDQLKRGADPDSADWGAEPQAQWGRLTVGEKSRPVATIAGRYQRFYELLSEALGGAGPLPVDIDDVIATLRVIEAAQASAREQRVISRRHGLGWPQ